MTARAYGRDLDILKWWTDGIKQFNPGLEEFIASISRKHMCESTKTMEMIVMHESARF